MGETHFRSDVIEHGTRRVAFTNASLVVATIGTLKVTGGAVVDGTSTLTGAVGCGAVTSTGAVSGTILTGTTSVIVGAGADPKYIKLGSLYIISGNPGSFDNAGLSGAATLALAVANTASVPTGCLMLNASSNLGLLQAAYVKISAASWSTLTTASNI